MPAFVKSTVVKSTRPAAKPTAEKPAQGAMVGDRDASVKALAADLATKVKGSKPTKADRVAKGVDRAAEQVAAATRKPKAEKTPKAPAKPKANIRPDGLREGSAGARMVDAVLRPEGVTHSQLKQISGWDECRPRFKESCVRAGVTVTLVREGKGEGTYFGKRA